MKHLLKIPVYAVLLLFIPIGIMCAGATAGFIAGVQIAKQL